MRNILRYFVVLYVNDKVVKFPGKAYTIVLHSTLIQSVFRLKS